MLKPRFQTDPYIIWISCLYHSDHIRQYPIHIPFNPIRWPLKSLVYHCYITINASKATIPNFPKNWKSMGWIKHQTRGWFLIPLLTLRPIDPAVVDPSLPRNQGDNPGSALTAGIDQMSYLGRNHGWMIFQQQKSGPKHQTWWQTRQIARTNIPKEHLVYTYTATPYAASPRTVTYVTGPCLLLSIPYPS